MPYESQKDNQNHAVTMDFRFDRINVEIYNGLVTKSNIG